MCIIPRLMGCLLIWQETQILQWFGVSFFEGHCEGSMRRISVSRGDKAHYRTRHEIAYQVSKYLMVRLYPAFTEIRFYVFINYCVISRAQEAYGAMPENLVPAWDDIPDFEMTQKQAMTMYLELLRVCIDILLDNNYMDLTHNVYGTASILEAYPPPDVYVDGRTDSPALIRTKALFQLLGGFALVNFEAACAIEAGVPFHPTHVPIIMGHKNKLDKTGVAVVQRIREELLSD
jgi:hypothetical protein